MPENIIQIDRHMPRTRLDRPTCGIVSGMIQSSAINGSATKNRARQAVPLHLRGQNQSAQKTDVISDHQSDTTTQILLWKQLFNQEDLYQRLFKILQILGILLVICISYTLIDFVRHGLFSVTVNRSRGHWFELVWTKMPHKVQAFRSVHTSDLIE